MKRFILGFALCGFVAQGQVPDSGQAPAPSRQAPAPSSSGGVVPDGTPSFSNTPTSSLDQNQREKALTESIFSHPPSSGSVVPANPRPTGFGGDSSTPSLLPAGALRLGVSLRDGSLLLGETSLAGIPLSTEGMGNIAISLRAIDDVFFSQDHGSASANLRNGDKIQGNVPAAYGFSLKTLVGEVGVPFGLVQEMHVYPAGSGRLPLDSDATAPPAPGLENNKSALRLGVCLTDGSRLLGETSLAGIPMNTEGVGKVVIPLKSIDAVAFSQNQGLADVTFRNGDKIRGNVADGNVFTLKTSVGEVEIPLGLVAQMQVYVGGTGMPRPDWVVLPFPQNCEWNDSRGQAAEVGANEIVLRGQPVRTKQTYSAPLRFEFVAMLDDLVSNDGCIWIELIPDGQDAELNVPPRNVAIQLGYHQRGEGGGMFTIADVGGQPADLGSDPFTFEAGKPYHLEIGVKADGIRVVLNGRVFESKIVIPFKSFHIELMGWQPTNTWRVRDFIVH